MRSARSKAECCCWSTRGPITSLSLRFLEEDELRRPRMQMAGRMIAVAGGYYPGFAAEVDEVGSGGGDWRCVRRRSNLGQDRW